MAVTGAAEGGTLPSSSIPTSPVDPSLPPLVGLDSGSLAAPLDGDPPSVGDTGRKGGDDVTGGGGRKLDLPLPFAFASALVLAEASLGGVLTTMAEGVEVPHASLSASDAAVSSAGTATCFGAEALAVALAAAPVVGEISGLEGPEVCGSCGDDVD